jgi:signal transduction histidine kinase
MTIVERQASAVSARYMQAQELLSTVRAQVLLASVSVRDALLDPNPATANDYRRQLDSIRTAVDQALAQYVPVLDSAAERERLAQLRREVDDFLQTLSGVLATDSRRWSSEARGLLSSRIAPKREVAIRVSEEVQALNRSAFVQQQADVASIYSATQRRIWQSLGFVLAASLGIASVATVYAGRLEGWLSDERAKDLQNTRDLRRLSAQLVSVQEDERRTIARELHDEVGQVLTAIKVELSLVQHALEARDVPVQVLDDARALTDGALHTIRDLSHLLHPALLDDLGLPAAIEWHLRAFGRRHDVRVDLLHGGMDHRIATQTETAIFRIVQEALTNVAKHAAATTCRVYLQRLPHSVLVTIEDNGHGFIPADANVAGARTGLGLINIRERASQLHGTLRLESAPGKGTRLTVELPAQDRVPDDANQPAESLEANVGSDVSDVS